MRYFLDTDTLIYFLKGNKNVVDHLSGQSSSDLATTIVNHTELLFGAYHSAKIKENLNIIHGLLKTFEIVPFCEQASLIFAEEKARLKKKGNLVADLDLMIASISLKHEAVLVTNNIKHFDRIPNIQLENWTLHL